MKRINDEVYYNEDEILRVTSADIQFLKAKAMENPRRRCRLCAHRTPDDALHEMLIVHTSATYVRPHKHPLKNESFHVIEGLMSVVIFDEEGRIRDVIEMGEYA